MDFLMNILCVFLFAAQVNAPNHTNINESSSLTNNLQMSPITEVNSLSKRRTNDLQVFKERVSDGIYTCKVWMSPTSDHSFRVVKASWTDKKFIGCSERGSENSAHLIYIALHGPSSWQYVYSSEGSIQIDGMTYNISEIDEFTPPSGMCLDPMLHTTITITKTVTETSEMTATACYSEGTATPDPSVNPGTISDQTFLTGLVAKPPRPLTKVTIIMIIINVFQAVIILAVLFVIAIIIILALGGIIAYLCLKPKKVKEPMDGGNPNGSGENEDIQRPEEETPMGDGYSVKENAKQDKVEKSLGRLPGGSHPLTGLTRTETDLFSNNESKEKTTTFQDCSVDSNIENKCSESVDSGLKPSQDASGNNLATCAITVKCQTLDDSQAVMQDGH